MTFSMVEETFRFLDSHVRSSRTLSSSVLPMNRKNWSKVRNVWIATLLWTKVTSSIEIFFCSVQIWSISWLDVQWCLLQWKSYDLTEFHIPNDSQQCHCTPHIFWRNEWLSSTYFLEKWMAIGEYWIMPVNWMMNFPALSITILHVHMVEHWTHLTIKYWNGIHSQNALSFDCHNLHQLLP